MCLKPSFVEIPMDMILQPTVKIYMLESFGFKSSHLFCQQKQTWGLNTLLLEGIGKCMRDFTRHSRHKSNLASEKTP